MAAVNYLYRSTRDKAQLNLRLLYRYEGKDYVIGGKIPNNDNTKDLEVSKEYWNNQHNTKKFKKARDIEEVNRIEELKEKQQFIQKELDNLEAHILKAFYSADPTSINKKWLNLQIEYYFNPPTKNREVPTNLAEYIDFYIDYREDEIKKTSRTKYNVIKKKIEKLQIKLGKPILIQDINEDFKREFVKFYKSEKYSQNTMQRELGFIKTFCKHARTLGVETDPQLDQLKLSKQKVEKIYLNFDELEKIENKKGLSEHLDNARDWLIISCYIGQRISDFMRFDSSMIRVENGKSLLEFTQKKTGKLMTVPLHSKVLEILKKRNGEFPRSISDQRYNDYIKDVCQEAEINAKIIGSKQAETEKDSGIYRKQTKEYYKYELVTSHIGRRSFATNFYGQIPTTYLIYITGHSTEAMFLNYIGKSNKDLAMEITNYF